MTEISIAWPLMKVAVQICGATKFPQVDARTVTHVWNRNGAYTSRY